jgi:hypothetical protein
MYSLRAPPAKGYYRALASGNRGVRKTRNPGPNGFYRALSRGTSGSLQQLREEYGMTRNLRTHRPELLPLTIAPPKAVNVPKTWVAASELVPMAVNDPIVPYLNRYGGKYSAQSDIPRTLDYGTFIRGQGNRFEEAVIQKIKNQFPPTAFIQIVPSSCKVPHLASRNIDMYKKTMKAVETRIPIIYQGVLHNKENRTVGVPDLIVRGDFIPHLVQYLPDMIPSELYSMDRYYIIDIKFHTLNLNADGQTLRNDSPVRGYKEQLAVYTLALNLLQPNAPAQYAFLLGRRTTEPGSTAFTQLGTIEYLNRDKTVIQDLNAHLLDFASMPTWNGVPRPNMKNVYDSPWSAWKKTLAKESKEITLVWQCGVAARQKALDQGIHTYTDPDLTAELMGFQGTRAKTINAILRVNRNDFAAHLTGIPQIPGNDWAPLPGDIFVDFESINDTMDSMLGVVKDGSAARGTFINMIGIGHTNPVGNFAYEVLTAVDLTPSSQTELLCEFVRWMRRYSRSRRMFHWGHHERTTLKFFLDHDVRMPKTYRVDLEHVIGNSVDLCARVQAGPMCVRGALNFSLKSMTNALHDMNLISTTFNLPDESDDMSNGMEAMLAAGIANTEYSGDHNKTLKDHPLIQKCIVYNEKDVHSIWEICRLIRTRRGYKM